MSDVVKGLYILSALDVIERKGGADVARSVQADAALPPGELSSLRDYPQRQLSHVVKLGKERCFASMEDNDAVRMFGAAAFEAWAGTMIGKVGVALTRLASPEQVARALARMHNASTTTSVMEAVDFHPKGFRLRVKGAVHAWYQLGLNEAGFAKNAPIPATVTLEVKKHSVDDMWMPAPDCEFDLVIVAD